MSSLNGTVVCGHCWLGHGTLITAAGGVLVHKACREIYEMSHPVESAKSQRKAKREERRASKRKR